MTFPSLVRSPTECRMIPNNSQVYGKAMNWHYVAINIAKKQGEACDHIDLSNILIAMAPLTTEIILGIKFFVSCNVCGTKYENTSKKLSEKFIKFYGL